MDYRFNKYSASTLYCTRGNIENFVESENIKPVVKFGRQNYEVNDVRVPGGTSISRRHCVIINYRNDIWIYDLSSTGTYVNERKVNVKAHLIGRNTVRLGNIEYEITNDRSKLF